MSKIKPFQLLEITIISAQDLEPVSKKIKTYATAWIHANRKLATRVDTDGNTNPTWNDKFVFRVNEEFLRCDTSAVMIEIYSTHWFRDNLVGTVRVLVGNLIPPAHRSQYHHNHNLGMRFVALQVRRPSGRPQGILNIGVAVLDSSMRSMPLYKELCASAVGMRDLMEDESYYDNTHNNKKNDGAPPVVKPILRRSRSERSERMTFDGFSTNTSMVAIPQQNGSMVMGSSILSVSEFHDPIKGKGKVGKASSVISGAELKEKPKEKGKKGKASSLISVSILSKDSKKIELKNESPILMVKDVNNKVSNVKLGPELNDQPAKKIVDEKSITKSPNGPIPPRPPPKEVQGPVIGKPITKLNNGYEYGGPKMNNGKLILGQPQKANSYWTDSEVGPSPSEVAAAMVERRYPLDDERSSVLDGWSVDESVEGLRSKLERWRTELPPIYDRRLSSSTSTFRSSHHARRHTDGGTGLFSCFGNIYGYECQCICGKPTGKRGSNTRFHSPSIGSAGRSF